MPRKKPDPKDIRYNEMRILLSDEERATLEEAATREGSSMSEVVRRALRDWVGRR